MKILDVKELRIGNYINYAYFPNNLESIEPVLVSGIIETHISYKEDNKEFTYQIEEFRPIPLTEEILIKAGFEKGSVFIDDLEISVNIKNNLLTIQQNGEHFGVQIDIEYLHQLQNIIFDLIGKELEIKF